MERLSGKIEIIATALDAIHHGAGTSGNTQLLRMQEIIGPDGQQQRTPYLSGNSLKHMVREHGARFALEAMSVEDGSLTKPVVDLLFSGGALNKAGAAVDLARARRLETLFPILGLCGYSAGNVMTESKVHVDNLHVACSENAWRMPEAVRDLPQASTPARRLRGEEFGTRHEQSRRQRVSRLLTTGEHARVEGGAVAALADAHPAKGDSNQMIYDFQTIKPGAVFWGALKLNDVTDLEVAALRSALSHACEGVAPDGGLLFRVGAKSAIGLGRVAMRLTGFLREPVRAPDYTESESLAITSEKRTPELGPYVEHLKEHRDEILEALRESVS